MNFKTVVTAKTKFTKDEFKRAVMIHLSKETSTPLDILDAEFSDVRETTEQIATMSAHIETDYRASIGYHRRETYYEKNSDGDLVEKTRTVTDWKPFGGHASGDQDSYCFNERVDNDNAERRKVFEQMNSYLTVYDLTEEGSAVLLNEALKTLTFRCEVQQAQSISAGLPGDEYKDFDWDNDVTIKEVNCLIVPVYKMTYKYKGKEYSAESYACGLLSVRCTAPERDDKVQDEAKAQTKKEKTAMIATWITFGALYAAAWGLFSLEIYWAFPFPLVALIAAIVLHSISDKAYNQKLNELTQGSQATKLKKLETIISELNYEKLSESELKLFDSTSEAFLSNEKKNTLKIPAIICSIAMLPLIITSICYL